jgi:aminoacyl tRNA synthase complex-interacting multifunctional protein 1
LKTRAFLVPASQPTLADLAMGTVLLQTKNNDSLSSYPNVTRWLTVVHAVLKEALGEKLMAFPVVPPPLVVPVFYDGTEDPSSVLKQPEPAAQADNKKKQPPKEQQQQQGGNNKKQEKPQNKPAQKQQQSQQATVDFDISALDIRVGKIIKVWPHETADKLFCETIDLGTETREIASGLRPFYKTEELQDKTVLVLCNLKKRNLVGFPSHGMVLCASNADHTQVQIVVPPEGTALGERVLFDGYSGDPEPENKIAKKKVFEKLAPDLKTNDKGEVLWKEAFAKTSKGIAQAIGGMANGQVS